MLSIQPSTSISNYSVFSGFLYASGIMDENIPLIEHKAFAVQAEACLIKLYNDLNEMTGEETETEIQSVFYEAGKLEFKDNLRLWFSVCYWVMHKNKEGPRPGAFTKLVGIEKILDLIHRALYSPFD